ncbi:MAG: hypothetical protein HRT66_01175 [Flavobacteriaceae bacterium]|nr:hypothetical protein [Flavobacteriaceae bacterium]
MLKSNNLYFFDVDDFEEIIQYYLDYGNIIHAYKAVKIGLNQHPNSLEILLLKVDLLLLENKTSQACEILNYLDLTYPEDEDVNIQKGFIYSNTRLHRQAISCFEIAIKNTDQQEYIYHLIGLELLYLEDFQEAIISFKKSISIYSEDTSSMNNIVYCYNMIGETKNCILFLKYYIDENPYCEISWQQIGVQYNKINKYNKALESFDNSILIDEEFIGAYLERAKTLEKLKLYDIAIEDYQHTISLEDATAFAYYRIGRCYYFLENIELSIEYLEKSVYEDPMFEKSLYMLSEILYEKEYFEKSLENIESCIASDSSNKKYWGLYLAIGIKLNNEAQVKIIYSNILNSGVLELKNCIDYFDFLYKKGYYIDAIEVLKTYENKHAEIEYRLYVAYLKLKELEISDIHKVNASVLDPNKFLLPKIKYLFFRNKMKTRDILNTN